MDKKPKKIQYVKMATILNRRPSYRQKKSAKIKLDNPQLDDKEVVALGGYSEAIQHNPAKVTESVGFKKALAEYGLTEELVTTSLVEDIKRKPRERLGEMRLGAEILKMNEREGGNNKTLIVVVAPETSRRYAASSNAGDNSI